MITKERLMDTMLELVSVPSISGTRDEDLGAQKIHEMISSIQYFKDNPENLKSVPVENDPLNRHCVAALFKSSVNTNKTLILTGHLDVVGIEEYGHLKDIAFDPVEFTKRVSELNLDDNAKADLESGKWIFGRGTADMKFGIALGIELLREFSTLENFEGNILFIAVPGEESNSEGMLAAAPYLAELQSEGYEFIGLHLLECYMVDPFEDKKRIIHVGACGKIMPLFFFAGKETHVAEPFEGINPNLMASELNRLFELNIDFCDSTDKVTTPPPICLKQSDLKDIYSVQSPLYAASYYNLITLNSKPEELVEKLKEVAAEAFENAINQVENIRKELEKKSNTKIPSYKIEPCVLTFDELFSKVKDVYGDDFEREINNKIVMWQREGVENQEIATRVIKETYEKYPNKVPMIVIAFAPPFYPDKYPKAENKITDNFFKVISDTISYAREKHNENIVLEDYYMGISDLSYTGLGEDNEIEHVYKNMPGSGVNYTIPIESLKKIDIPGFVLGGLGKDFHKYSERLNIPYSFEVLPDLCEYSIKRFFELNK